MPVTEQFTVFHKMIKDIKIFTIIFTNNFNVCLLSKRRNSFAGTAKVSLRYMLIQLSKKELVVYL